MHRSAGGDPAHAGDAEKTSLARLLDSFVEKVVPRFEVTHVGPSRQRRALLRSVEFVPRQTQVARNILPEAMEVGAAHRGTGSWPRPGRSWPGRWSSARAREMVTRPSSSGWRSTSRLRRLNSGSSSRNRTPWWASEISPGAGGLPPPTMPASLMVWCGERNGRRRQQRLVRLQPAHGAVDARRLQALGRRQRRQDRRQPLGQHRLAGPGRADHQDVVAPAGGDHEGALGELLAAHVGEVDVVAVQLARTARRCRPSPARRAAAPRGCRPPRPGEPDGVDGRLPRRRRPRGRWRPGRAAAGCRCCRRRHRHRQRALDRPHAAVEGQLADQWRSRAAARAAAGRWPTSRPRAMGRSKPPASLGRSAGARLMTVRPGWRR